MDRKESFRKFNTVLHITFWWTIISITVLLFELTIVKEYGLEYRWSADGDFMSYLMINTFSFVLNGFVGGLVVVYFLLPWIRDRSYKFGLLFGIGIYIVLFITLTCIQNYFVIRSIWDQSTPFIDAYFKGLEDYFLSYEFIRLFPFWLLVLIGTIVALFVNDKYGPGIFKKFLLGRYFHPQVENRIFMFLDLKGSTTIAEQLGERNYFNFIRQVYKDVTTAILVTGGEIYQYVGDEIVITWSALEKANALRSINCFYEIQSVLKKKADDYIKNFDVAPEFKAGIHVGNAIIGEIGVIKRDIAYSGDVLNTTARMQGKCNELGVSLVFSKQLLELIPKTQFEPVILGEFDLRGKSEKVELYTLN